MKQEDKKLLLQYLCGRLPYGVVLECCEIVGEQLRSIDDKGLINNDYDIDEVKPLLFPLSSMTKEQSTIYHELVHGMFGTSVLINLDCLIDFFNRNHLDWRGLIPLGLAIDATNKNVYGYETRG